MLNAAAAMPNSLRPVVKKNGAGGSQAEVGLQEEPDAGRAVQRRRVGEAGDAAWNEVQMRRLNMESQAQVIQGVEQSRVLEEELQQAKVQIAELNALLKTKNSELRRVHAENARLKTYTPPPPPPCRHANELRHLRDERHKCIRKLAEDLVDAQDLITELQKNAEALQSIIKSKDSAIQSKDALLQRITGHSGRRRWWWS